MAGKTTQAQTDHVVDLYLRGGLIGDIVVETKLSRTTVLKILQRSGKTPRRFAEENEVAEAQLLAGLREYVRFLERAIDEKERENRQLQRRVRQLERSCTDAVT